MKPQKNQFSAARTWPVIALIFILPELGWAQPTPGTSSQKRVDTVAPNYSPSTATTPRTSQLLSENDQRIFTDGEIGTGQYVAGGILGSYFGFGIGHGVQGTWSERGWKFTVAELVGAGFIVTGALGCMGDTFDGKDECDTTLVTIGLIEFYGARIWEIFDVWWYPVQRNKRYRELKSRDETQANFTIVPKYDGALAALVWNF